MSFAANYLGHFLLCKLLLEERGKTRKVVHGFLWNPKTFHKNRWNEHHSSQLEKSPKSAKGIQRDSVGCRVPCLVREVSVMEQCSNVFAACCLSNLVSFKDTKGGGKVQLLLCLFLPILKKLTEIYHFVDLAEATKKRSSKRQITPGEDERIHL